MSSRGESELRGIVWGSWVLKNLVQFLVWSDLEDSELLVLASGYDNVLVTPKRESGKQISMG